MNVKITVNSEAKLLSIAKSAHFKDRGTDFC